MPNGMSIMTTMINNLINVESKWHLFLFNLLLLLLTWMSNGMSIVTNLSSILNDMHANWHFV
jgi:hypothetical protein